VIVMRDWRKDAVEKTFDVTILGAGPGGYVAAIRAAQLGLDVALVEKEHLGGVCLNWGCIPTKALLRNAEVISLLGRGKEFGFSVGGLEVDFGAAVDRSRKVSDRLVKGIGALMRKNGVEVIEGTGTLQSPGAVKVALNAGGARTVETRNIIVATGGRARTIPGIEVDGERVLTYREAIVLRELPASAVVVGAGPIGMEFAHVWSTYGAQVTARSAAGGRGGQQGGGARLQATQGATVDVDARPGRGDDRRRRAGERCG
jgi:dihydrolipoamide dehydrogenase